MLRLLVPQAGGVSDNAPRIPIMSPDDTIKRIQRVRWLWRAWLVLVPFPMFNILVWPVLLSISNSMSIHDLATYLLQSKYSFYSYHLDVKPPEIWIGWWDVSFDVVTWIASLSFVALLIWGAEILFYRTGVRKHLAAIENGRATTTLILLYGLGLQITSCLSFIAGVASIAILD
jgi:hypothetical protein